MFIALFHITVTMKAQHFSQHAGHLLVSIDFLKEVVFRYISHIPFKINERYYTNIYAWC